MPIDKGSFNKGRIISTTEQAVLNFLRTHRDKAYTQRELAAAVGVAKGQNFLLDLLDSFTFTSILETLVKEREITKREIQGTVYYATK